MGFVGNAWNGRANPTKKISEEKREHEGSEESMSVSYGDKALEKLRSLITIVDRELAGATPSEELRTAWAQMIEVLAPGAAPELRECPHCHEVGMRAATRCSRCWSSLPPLPPLHAPAQESLAH
jgi:hypothetical protein